MNKEKIIEKIDLLLTMELPTITLTKVLEIDEVEEAIPIFPITYTKYVDQGVDYRMDELRNCWELLRNIIV